MNRLTPIEYQQAAERTFPDLGMQNNISHMIMGMNSEIDELYDAIDNYHGGEGDTTNIKEEIADGEWYGTNYARMFGFKQDEIDFCLYEVTGDSVKALCIALSKLNNGEKRALAYKKEFNQGVRFKLLVDLFSAYDTLYKLYRIDKAQARYNNIAKLVKRYPEKFTEWHALNRDLQSELIALKK